MTSVLTIGEALGLAVAAERGRVAAGTPMAFRVAGSELNTAVALARLGMAVQFAGAVGEDVAGRVVRDTLRQEGVGAQYLEVGTEPTGLMIQEFYGLGAEPRVHYYRRQTSMHAWIPSDSLMEAMDADSWLHLSGITLMFHQALRDRLHPWIARWSERHPDRFSLDVNMRRRLGNDSEWRAALEPIMQLAALVFCSRHDLAPIFGTEDAAAVWDRHGLGDSQVLVVTDGSQGARAYRQGQEIAHTPAVPVARVVDVVGAGDGFAAGVLAGRLWGWEYEQSLGLGAVVGAFAVAHPGDFEGYPMRADAEAVLHRQWVDR